MSSKFGLEIDGIYVLCLRTSRCPVAIKGLGTSWVSLVTALLDSFPSSCLEKVKSFYV